MQLSKFDVAKWQSDAVAQRYRALLDEAIQEYTNQIINLERDNNHRFVSSYYYLKGLIDGVKLARDADLIQEEEIATDGGYENL